jgi:hypothetical protein
VFNLSVVLGQLLVVRGKYLSLLSVLSTCD